MCQSRSTGKKLCNNNVGNVHDLIVEMGDWLEKITFVSHMPHAENVQVSAFSVSASHTYA